MRDKGGGAVSAVYALYGEPEAAQRAVDDLRAAGIAEGGITVNSSEPFDEYEFGRRGHATVMPWVAAAGGVVGGCAGFWLASLTQTLWPLPTGGMPIVAGWANAIVTFELAMLGVILATCITLLVAARLPTRKAALYDPQISEGKILVGVPNPPGDLLADLQTRLHQDRRGEVKLVH